VLAAKAALREKVWSAMRAAKVARFPGPAGRIPNFTGAEAAAERLRSIPEWQAAGTLKANPDSAQLPVRQRALEEGRNLGENHGPFGIKILGQHRPQAGEPATDHRQVTGHPAAQRFAGKLCIIGVGLVSGYRHPLTQSVRRGRRRPAIPRQ
jgi:5-formyltetrahydrofolate cyclo-ligase family